VLDDGSGDEVARIVTAWRRERPDLDVGPLEVLSRVSRLARYLDLARRATFASQGLETWSFDVLAALRRQGPPYQLSPGTLAAETLVTSGTMTNRIDRLEEHGLVRRLPSPDDRRGVLVELTDTGRTRVDAAMVTLLEAEHHLLAGIPTDDVRALASLLQNVLTPLRPARGLTPRDQASCDRTP
jgi:DNA-binding MarR family transcriptional regulator